MAKLSLEELREIRSREEKKLRARDIHGKTIHVVVGMGTSGLEAGAKTILNTIADCIEEKNLETVILTQTGSLKPLKEPVVEVYEPSKGLTIYESVNEKDAKRIVNEHIVEGKILLDKRVEAKEE